MTANWHDSMPKQISEQTLYLFLISWLKHRHNPQRRDAAQTAEEWKDLLREIGCECVIECTAERIWEWKLSFIQIELHSHSLRFLTRRQRDAWLLRSLQTECVAVIADAPDLAQQTGGSFSLDRLCSDSQHPESAVSHIHIPNMCPWGIAHRTQNTGELIKSLRVRGKLPPLHTSHVFLLMLIFVPQACQIFRQYKLRVSSIGIEHHRSWKQRILQRHYFINVINQWYLGKNEQNLSKS